MIDDEEFKQYIEALCSMVAPILALKYREEKSVIQQIQLLSIHKKIFF